MTSNLLISPVKRRKVHEDIAAQLENLITSGALREGDSLPAERTLMEQFGVGRPAVREAMLTLERGGLLKLSSGERATVSRPTTAIVLDGLSASVRVAMATEEGMRNFQAARSLFEVALARNAAKHATPAQLKALQAALQRNKEAIGDPHEFERTDVAFHYEIARIAGNPLFAGMHEALVGWLTEQRTVSLRGANVDRMAYKFHRLIFQAIEAGDPDRAETAIVEHLDAVVTTFWKIKAAERGDHA